MGKGSYNLPAHLFPPIKIGCCCLVWWEREVSDCNMSSFEHQHVLHPKSSDLYGLKADLGAELEGHRWCLLFPPPAPGWEKNSRQLQTSTPQDRFGANLHRSSVLNLVAAEEKYQIPSAKSSTELAKGSFCKRLEEEIASASLPRIEKRD